jgi:hypothetical protein
MKARLIVCGLLAAGAAQAAGQVRAQGPVPTWGGTGHIAPPEPPQAVPEPPAPEIPEPIPVPPVPVPLPAPEAAPEEQVELTAAELAAMGLATEAGNSSAALADTALKLSGFADVGMLTGALPKDSPWAGVGAVNRHTSFYVGNLNLYLAKNLTDSIRMFGEVRFMLLPNGAPDHSSMAGKLIDTGVDDYTDFGRTVDWGGINIQRLYIEWTAYRALQFRAGQYLTPYGIWNVDHGSPTIIPVQKPFIIGQRLFPERQTGIEIFGQLDASAHHSLGYNLTLSNGTGPAVAYRDLDGNKALGGRVWWRFDGLGELRVGGSGYYGRYTSATQTPGIGPDGMHAVYVENIQSAYDTLSLAADLKWTFAGLLFQSELVTQQRKYVESGRVGSVQPLLGQYLAPNDKFSWGAYGLIGYRFEWFGIMPYFLLQYITSTEVNTGAVVDNSGFSAGLNIRPIDALVFKLEYDEGRFPKGSLISSDPVRIFQAQIAWAF